MRNEQIESYITEQLEEIKKIDGTELENYISNLIIEIANVENIELEENNILDISDDNKKLELLEAIYESLENENDKKVFFDTIQNMESELGTDIIKNFKEKNKENSENKDDKEDENNKNLDGKDNSTPDNSDIPKNSDGNDGTDNNNSEKTELEGPAITQYKKETEELKKELAQLEAKEQELENKKNELKSLEENLLKLETELNEKRNNNDLNIEELENLINKTKEQIEKLKEEIKKEKTINVEEEIERLKKENLYSEEFASAYDLNTYAKELENKEKTKSSLNELLEKTSNELNIKTNELERLTEELASIADLSNRLAIQMDIKKIEEEIEILKTKEEKIKNQLNEIDQDIEKLNEIVKNEDYLTTFNKVTEQLNIELNNELEQEKKLVETKQNLTEEINNIKVNIETLEKEINEINIVLRNNISNVNNKQIEKLQQILQNKNVALQLERNKLNEKEKELETIDKEINFNKERQIAIESEIKARNTYLEIINKINGLFDKEYKQEDVESIANEINSSELDEDLKNELNTKLKNTTEFIKNNKGKSNKTIEELRKEIQEREENIKLYYEALNDIKDIENDIKNGKDQTNEEVINKVTAVKEKISKLPESLKNELQQYLDKALAMKIENVEKDPNKRNKWLAGIAGFAFGAGLIALTPLALPGAIGVAIGSQVLKKVANNLHEKYKELDKENVVTNIEKPTGKLAQIKEKFKNWLKDDNNIEKVNWFLNGTAIGALTAGTIEQIISMSNTTSITKDNLIKETPNTDPYSNVKIGDSANGMDLSTGYDQANWASQNINAESLNQTIMHDGNSVIQSARVGNQTINTAGKSIAEIAQEFGVAPEDIVLNITNKEGVARAWVDAGEAIGRTL